MQELGNTVDAHSGLYDQNVFLTRRTNASLLKRDVSRNEETSQKKNEGATGIAKRRFQTTIGGDAQTN